MKSSSVTVLKAFLSSCDPSKRKALEHFLPQEEQKLLDELPDFEEEFHPESFENGDLWETVHWSWFLPTLRTYDDSEQKLFLSALTRNAAKNLARALTLSSYQQELTQVAQDYLRQLLIDSLTGTSNELLPISCLPPSNLKPLLKWQKKQLTELIDRLSLYDLSAEMRQIVETKILKKIYSLLTDDEREALKNIMTHKDAYPHTRIGLDRWDGSEETLRTLLHRKGLARFATALSGQHPDFIWYICHQLDIGRGTALFKLCAKEKIPTLTDLAITQIQEQL